MSMLAWLFESTGSFDKVRLGGYDLGSACGFVQECEDTKDCINRVCVPVSDSYGGGVYANCVSYCNYDPNMQNIGDLLCEDPQNAFASYGYECENYNPKGFVNLFGLNLSYIKIGSFIMFLIVIYYIYKNLK